MKFDFDAVLRATRSGDGACSCCFVREEKEDKNVKNSLKNKNKKREKVIKQKLFIDIYILGPFC